MKTPIWVAILLLAGGAEAAAQGWGYGGQGGGGRRSQTGTAPGTNLGAKLRAWQATMEGDTKSDEDFVPGSNVDIDDTLGLDADQNLFDFTLWGVIPLIGTARVSYMTGSLEGDAIASADFTFSGSTFTAGSPIKTNWDLESWAIMYDYPLLSEQIGAGAINGNAQIGYMYHFFQAEVSSPTAHGSDAFASTSVTLGLRIFTELASWLWADLEINYAILDLRDEVDTDYLEYSIDLQVIPFEELFIGIGWRHIELEVDDDRGSNFEFDGEIEGFFLSVSYHF